MSAPEILIVEDEPQIQKVLTITLEANGFRTVIAPTAKIAIANASSRIPDVILLDLGLPDMSGQQLLLLLKEKIDRPVIILSVQSAEEEIVKALENGASDYVVKPFRAAELVARIRTAMRIRHKNAPEKFSQGVLTIDLETRVILKDESEVKLTGIEYKLLALLIRHAGRVLTHRFLLTEVWGPGHSEQTQYLRVFVAQLRKKIEPNPDAPNFIITESGVGYRWATED